MLDEFALQLGAMVSTFKDELLWFQNPSAAPPPELQGSTSSHAIGSTAA